MHVKCQYCGTDCWDVEARNGHEVLCDQNPANGKVGEKLPIPVTAVDMKAHETELGTSEKAPVPTEAVLVFGGKAHPGETPEEVIKIDRTYIEWAASLSSNPAIKQRCKELLMATKK